MQTNTYTNKSVFSLVNSAVNMALPASAAEHCAAALLLLGACCCRSTFSAHTALSSKLPHAAAAAE